MKFREVKKGVWDRDNNWRGVKKKYVVEITENTLNTNPSFYFLIEKEDIGFAFNSLWKNLSYKSFEECCTEAERYLDEEVLNAKRRKEGDVDGV